MGDFGRARRVLLAALVLTALGLRLFFWSYTHRTWEDALITVLHSENFFSDLGLTHYKVDEPPIHGFTSPLGLLLPMLGDRIRVGSGLHAIKLASALFGATAVLLVFLIFKQYTGLGPCLWQSFLAASYVAVEHHQILWGMAGMETQLATTLLLLSVYCYRVASPVLLGISLGLCLLVRPDFGIWVLLVGLVMLCRAIRTRSYLPLLQTTGAALLVYGPWVGFTTWYYGSPVPNTIQAKLAAYGLWWRETSGWRQFVGGGYAVLTKQLFAVLGPVFGGHGTGFQELWAGGLIAKAMLLLVVVGAAFTVWRRQRELYILYAALGVFTVYYTSLVPLIYPWYTVPLASLAVLLGAKGAGDILRSRILGWAVAASYVFSLAVFLPRTFRAERNIQMLVEEPVRAEIGRFLNRTAGPTETIACEPLGYVAYYSRRTVYDYPGLASRRVVDFIKATQKRGIYPMVQAFQPDYLVLRSTEYQGFRREPDSGWLVHGYEVLRRFQVPDQSRHQLLFWAANVDLDFYVLRKK